jgi:prepilin-type N-terminal cleavage/methylation domain-containing protein
LRQNRGFTLVELSIVLVVIGLIVGGVVGGQSLIKAAKVHSLVKEVNQIKVATSIYDLQYDAMPGDMIDASEYWPSVGNGNGDGVVAINNGFMGNAGEAQRAFQHLNLSGIYPFAYEYVYPTEVGKVYPESSWGNGAGYSYYVSQFAGQMYFDNSIIVGANPGVSFMINYPSFTPTEAKLIDKKVDDGLSGRGNVRAKSNSGYPPCIQNRAFRVDSTYYVGDELACSLIFFTDKTTIKNLDP